MGRRVVFYLFKLFLPAFMAPRGRGGGSQLPVVWDEAILAMLAWGGVGGGSGAIPSKGDIKLVAS